MQYTLCNLYFTNDQYLDHEITNSILKDIPYNAKLINSRTKQYSFLYILVPCDDFENIDDESAITFANNHFSNNLEYIKNDIPACKSVYHLFEPVSDSKFSLDIVSTITDDMFNIFYTDGSSARKMNAASWAYTKILEECYDPSSDPKYENLTKTYRKYECHSGRIDDGTNNIGELSAIKNAILDSGDKQIQIIVSDSEYSIKSFREWIHKWKKNNFKGSNKKTILNLELIQDIENNIESSGKIYLFKWVKSHVKGDDGTPFNELCDTLAKNELGIGTKE